MYCPQAQQQLHTLNMPPSPAAVAQDEGIEHDHAVQQNGEQFHH
jgi:hypothetical protein